MKKHLEISPPKQQKKKPRLKRAGLILVCFLLISAMVAGLTLWFFTRCHWGLFGGGMPYTIRPSAKPPQQLSQLHNGIHFQYNTRVVNLLLLGIDQTPVAHNQISAPQQADTIVLLSLDTRSRQSALLGIPRDTIAPLLRFAMNGSVSSTEEGPLCLGYATGGGGQQGGLGMAASVSYLLDDLPITRYLALEIAAIQHITNYVGGVEVTVTDDFSPVAGMPSGSQLLLDGDMAELYLRLRSSSWMDGSNISRMVRQKVFLDALQRQVAQRAKADITFLPKLYREIAPYITTNLTLREMIYIGHALFTAGELNLKNMAGHMSGCTDDSHFIIDEDAMRCYLREHCFLPALP